MQDLKITLCQIDQVWENKNANYEKYSACFESQPDSDVFVLPEMFQSGFSMNVQTLAEKWHDSPSLAFLKMWSAKTNAAIYTSLIIEEDNCFYNRGVFVQPNGEVVKYDKRKSFGLGNENQFYKSGNLESIVGFRGWKFMLEICYDLRFPELVRNYHVDGSPRYDILLNVANWPERRIEHWKALIRARAIENQCYAIGVNRVGTDGSNLIYNGQSACFDAIGEGTYLANQELTQPFILSFDKLNEIRTNLPFLKDY